MNKVELTTFATQEQILSEHVEYCKKMCRFYYVMAIKEFKAGDKKYALRAWNQAKYYYMQYHEAWGRWFALLDMKYKLGIDGNKYWDAIDQYKVEQEKKLHENINVDKVQFKFLYNFKKTMMGGK